MKTKILIVAVLLLWTAVSSAQNRKKIETQTLTIQSITTIEPDYYYYKPLADITTYELALLVPLLLPNDASGRQVHWRYRHQPGWPMGSGEVIIALDSYEGEKLGTAMRHLKVLPKPTRGPLGQQ